MPSALLAPPHPIKVQATLLPEHPIEAMFVELGLRTKPRRGTAPLFDGARRP